MWLHSSPKTDYRTSMSKDEIKQTHTHKEKPNQGSWDSNKNSKFSRASEISLVIIGLVTEVQVL
jgi:hypothetical protein